MRWVVDAMNVIGSRPDGWWRDRDAAVRRLLDDLARFAASGEEVTAVLDAGPAGLASPGSGVQVRVAARRGRDAADDEIVGLVAADPAPASVRVVTSDAALAARVRALGGEVEGAGTFRRRLDRLP